ncbi:LA2681 family HEPN domain-containing protein [Polaromonas sp.]|uniref:LA2681 family HEPN domain-containing protein n=1 Tax=Polaromonas sp. TaxID=1869339 RepID=UPI002730B672|nr:LA2681 family HEPN domain-containing protein [Polaromonas sp.]MDP1742688.1 LA2681 family HEPN domain-containing protein [Polaromonas sp.]
MNVTYQYIEDLIASGEFSQTREWAICALQELESESKKTSNTYRKLFRVAGLLIDIGSLAPDNEAVSLGLKTLETYQTALLPLVDEHHYHYCVGNAKDSLVPVQRPDQRGFASIRELVDVKNCFWRAIRATNGNIPPEYGVNLANSLKQQFRLAEALDWYDYATPFGISQAHINRSEALKLLNLISNSFTVKLLDEVASGYEAVLDSPEVPPNARPHYLQLAKEARRLVHQFCVDHDINPDLDHRIDEDEYTQQTDFRKFCIDRRLALSEHSLYCRCAASTRDNLTIPTVGGIPGEFIVPMEAVLNRLKSEFSFCRRMYFEYLHYPTDENLQHESCFSELLNQELLGLQVEKLRTSFRACFGILDKIAEAVCDLHGLHPSKGHIYFESFWQLNNPGRMAQFDAAKSPGLLALHSIATDLNGADGGEWAFFKKWRNALEHGALVLQPEGATDVWGSFKEKPGVILVSERDFVYHLEHLLRLTRSAIFSFVFLVRDHGLRMKEQNPDGISMPIYRQDFP